jgi:predicted porin
MNRRTRKFQVAGALVLAGVFAAQGAQAEMKMKVYGQVDRALLYVDDGNETTLFNVDNSNSSTRFGLDAKATMENGLTAGAKFEAEFQSNASTDVNQIQQKTDATFKERHLDFFLEGGFGKVSIGQGNTASNETSEVDLSGTSVIAYSDVKQYAGGIIFYDNTKGSIEATPAKPAVPAAATTPAVPATAATYNPKVKDVFNNLDGLSRDDRVRYDTPSFSGFTASVSYLSQKAWDAALRYSAEFGGTKVAAAVAYADFADQNTLVKSQINGSVSVLMPMGLSLTGAAGQQDLDDPSRKEDPMFWYAKLGYTAKLLFHGSTTFAVDYSASNDMKKDKDEATTYGAFVVQRLDAYNTELFLGYRSHALDRTGKDFADVTGTMGGARIKF